MKTVGDEAQAEAPDQLMNINLDDTETCDDRYFVESEMMRDLPKDLTLEDPREEPIENPLDKMDLKKTGAERLRGQCKNYQEEKNTPPETPRAKIHSHRQRMMERHEQKIFTGKENKYRYSF
ncbi:hypothetical protein AOLI_G00136910 [Acnodon oligacanthus]